MNVSLMRSFFGVAFFVGFLTIGCTGKEPSENSSRVQNGTQVGQALLLTVADCSYEKSEAVRGSGLSSNKESYRCYCTNTDKADPRTEPGVEASQNCRPGAGGIMPKGTFRVMDKYAACYWIAPAWNWKNKYNWNAKEWVDSYGQCELASGPKSTQVEQDKGAAAVKGSQPDELSESGTEVNYLDEKKTFEAKVATRAKLLPGQSTEAGNQFCEVAAGTKVTLTSWSLNLSAQFPLMDHVTGVLEGSLPNCNLTKVHLYKGHWAEVR
jgi:hypothetical protein